MADGAPAASQGSHQYPLRPGDLNPLTGGGQSSDLRGPVPNLWDLVVDAQLHSELRWPPT